MSTPQQNDDPAATAANYAPPQRVVNNSDLQAMIAELERKLSVVTAAAPQAPRVLTPDEVARAAADNAGAGLGVDERLNELYAVVSHLLSKVGL